MRYCTLDDLLLAIPEQTLVQLASDEPDAVSPDSQIIERAVSQSEETIDSYLRGHYTLPLSVVPPVLRDLTVALVRHWLYLRRPFGNDFPKAVTDSYEASLKTLSEIRDGKRPLGVEGGPANDAPLVVRVRSQRRQFTADALERF